MAVRVLDHIKLDLRIPLMHGRHGRSALRRRVKCMHDKGQPATAKRRRVQRSTSAGDEDGVRGLVINDIVAVESRAQ